MKRTEKDTIRAWARRWGISLSPAQVDQCLLYANELWEWNKKLNLTGLSSKKAVVEELLLDSLIACPFLPDQGDLLDVGSGAGFPAIPIKISKPKLTVRLIEANSKKVSFLREIIRITGMASVEVTRGRIEELGSLLLPKGYVVVTARALAPLGRTLGWCAPHLRSGGLLVTYQGQEFEKNLKKGDDPIKAHSLLLERVLPYTLPGKDSRRHVLFFRKRKEG